tara:strand:+ start:436 stop:639 length:204 start_codon:yes stop_codon:yes gene_type:complete
MKEQINTLITTKRAANILGVSTSRIRQLIRDGRIEAMKMDGSIWLVDSSSFEKFANQPRPAGRPRRG